MGFVRKIGREIDDAIHDIGSGIDDFVNDVIPGGWLGVAAGALLAVGITNPTLLGLAEEGVLTAEALGAAGVDAGALAADVAALSPEVIAGAETALASGASAESIATLTLEELAGLGADALTAGTDVIGLTSSELAGLGADAITAGTDVVGAVSPTGAENLTQIFDDGSTLITDSSGNVVSTTNATNGTLLGNNTQIFDDGSTLTTDSSGNVISSTEATNGTLLGNNTQVFDDGSTLTTDSSGNVISSTAATNGSLLTGGTTGGTSLIDTIKNVGSTVVDTLGTTGLLTAGALVGSTLAGGGDPKLTGPVGSGDVKYEWGQGIPLTSTGVNPGILAPYASRPDYQTTNPTDAQYYHGVRPLVATEADLANYNKLPVGAPATPWGAGPTAVGGQVKFNPQDFINQYILNPSYAGLNNATTGYIAPGPVVPG